MPPAPEKIPAAAADPDMLVTIVYARVYFAAGETHPRQPGDRQVLPLSVARALRSYQIADIVDDPDTRVVMVPVASSPVHSEPASQFRYNSGGLLIPPPERLIR